MEPKEYYVCEQEDKNYKEPKRKNCYSIIIFIIVVALAFTVGLLVGAMNAEIITAAMAAIIVLISMLALLLVLNIVLFICNKKYCKY